MSNDGEHLKRLEDKLDRVADTVSDMKVTLARNTDSLELHVKRTNLLEDEIKVHKDDDSAKHKEIDIRNAKQDVLVKIVVAMLGLPAIIYYVMQIVDKMRHM